MVSLIEAFLSSPRPLTLVSSPLRDDVASHLRAPSLVKPSSLILCQRWIGFQHKPRGGTGLNTTHATTEVSLHVVDVIYLITRAGHVALCGRSIWRISVILEVLVVGAEALPRPLGRHVLGTHLYAMVVAFLNKNGMSVAAAVGVHAEISVRPWKTFVP